jgi:hypothetical protein
MIDVDSGRIAYTVLSFGGFMKVGNKLFAIPWQALRLDAVNKQFVLNADKSVLEKAPGFDKDKPDLADPTFGNNISLRLGRYWRNRRVNEETSVRHRSHVPKRCAFIRPSSHRRQLRQPS